MSQRPRALTKKGTFRTDIVVRAATRIFIEQGYSAFTMRRVAEEARVGLGTLTYYFRDKNELLMAMYSHYYVSYARRVSTALSRTSADPHERLDAIIDFFIDDRVLGTSGQFDLEFWAYSRKNPVTQRVMIDSLEVTRRIFAGVIVEVKPSLSSSQAMRLATVVASLIDSLAFCIIPNHERPLSGRHVESDFKAVVRALVSAPFPPIPEQATDG